MENSTRLLCLLVGINLLYARARMRELHLQINANAAALAVAENELKTILP